MNEGLSNRRLSLGKKKSSSVDILSPTKEITVPKLWGKTKSPSDSSAGSPSESTSPFFSPRRNRASQRTLFKDGDALFTVCVTHDVVERDGYLHVKKDDKITMLYRNPPMKGVWLAMKGETNGLILAEDIDIVVPSLEDYLNAVDGVIREPALLEYENIEDKWVQLLAARGLLAETLERFVEEECRAKINTPYENTLFREGTPACRLITAILKVDEQCHAFKASFIEFLSPLEKHLTHEKKLLMALTGSIDYFNTQLKENKIPPAMVVVLRTIKKVLATLSVNPAEWSIKLGTIFFLRFICVACSEKPNLVIVGVALNMMAKRMDPATDHKLYGIADGMRELHDSTETLLKAMASLKMDWLPDEFLVYEAAVSFCDQVAEKYSAVLTVPTLKMALGEELDSVKIKERMRAIEDFISQSKLSPERRFQ